MTDLHGLFKRTSTQGRSLPLNQQHRSSKPAPLLGAATGLTVFFCSILASLTSEATTRFRTTSIDGAWSTSSVSCVRAGKSSAPNYDASVNMNIRGNTYSATGSVAGFTCSFSGSLNQSGRSAKFTILNDGGCSLGKYLGGGFSGVVSGNTMTVTLGQKVADALCTETGSSIRVRLRKAR